MQKNLYSILCLLFLAASARAGSSCSTGACTTKSTKSTVDCTTCDYGTKGSTDYAQGNGAKKGVGVNGTTSTGLAASDNGVGGSSNGSNASSSNGSGAGENGGGNYDGSGADSAGEDSGSGSSTGSSLSDSATEQANSLINNLIGQAGSSSASSSTGSAAGSASSSVSKAAQNATSSVNDAIKSATQSVKTASQNAAKSVSNATKSATNSVSNAAQNATSTASTSASNALNNASKTATNSINTAAQNATTSINNAANSATTSINTAAQNATTSVNNAVHNALETTSGNVATVPSKSASSATGGRYTSRTGAATSNISGQGAVRNARPTAANTVPGRNITGTTTGYATTTGNVSTGNVSSATGYGATGANAGNIRTGTAKTATNYGTGTTTGGYTTTTYTTETVTTDRNVSNATTSGSAGASSSLLGVTDVTSLATTALRGRVDCGAVTCSGPMSSFELQFRPMILKPSANNLDYGLYVCAKQNPFTGTDDYSVARINTSYDFGFDFGYKGMLPGCTSFGVNYERFDSVSNSDSPLLVQSTGAQCQFFPFYVTCPCSGAQYTAGAASVRFNFNTVHVNFGQFVQFGNNLSVEFFAGINASYIEEILTVDLAYNDEDLPNDRRILRTPMEFKGAGPEFGFDFDYLAFYGAKLAGRVSAAVLCGKSSNETSITSFTQGPTFDRPNPNIQYIFKNKNTQFVPEIQARIGGGCEFRFFNFMSNFEVGYEARVYFNALQYDRINTLSPTVNQNLGPIQVNPGSMRQEPSYFGLGGTYFSVSSAF